MWEVTSCSLWKTEEQSALGKDGWEPFAIAGTTMYFKRYKPVVQEHRAM